MMRDAARPVFASLALMAASSCVSFTGHASALRPLPRDTTPVWHACGATACAADARLIYLGVSGFLLTAGDESLMTAPSFTHPGLLAVLTPFWHVRSDSAAVDRELRRLLGNELRSLDGVGTILVGHSHYDHLMDVPLLARRYATRAVIHGDMTAKRTLMGDSALRAQPWRLDSLDTSAVATAGHPGRWTYSPTRRLRIMAVRSHHAPNWWFVTFASCSLDRDRAELPSKAHDWCLGESLSYVIDLLDANGHPSLRLFFQDAAAGPTDLALPHFPAEDDRPVDVLIVCAGNFDKPDDYPGFLVRALKPAHVVVAHWEDFFHDLGPVPTPIRRLDTRELAARLDLAAPGRWIALLPGGSVRVEY